MSPIGETVNANPEAVMHYASRMISRLQLDGAVLEVTPEGGAYKITISAPSYERLQFALGRLQAEFGLMGADVAAGKRR